MKILSLRWRDLEAHVRKSKSNRVQKPEVWPDQLHEVSFIALARIAGHSSITITQRYVHTQADTIEGIFARAIKPLPCVPDAADAKQTSAASLLVGTKLGTVEKP
jgi:hypothetical protein